MDKVCFYENEYYLFSNFSAHAVLFENKLYPTAEHAYQAAKFIDEQIKEKIRNAKSPSEAKKLSNIIYKEKKNKRPPEVKLNLMYNIVKEKVLQHDDVRETLIGTENNELVEDSQDDNFWGSGKEGNGQNQMGKILMKIRKEVQISGNS